ncbi:abortive infection system antitoxin AbiGi family protein [Echinicola jeungdonensis]|uniref:Abortive infection system antitoxin AbiGi family protein n=2 Tax=Echinicola jeungdonensis TaxID=709343 RepID=A0ABV5J2B4_9BACT|nr:abortive infection system antitoxin AbiGi family protein [Echinicola jeungdonensis]MDN3669777.1 abortive infection system antitoxin AbiGi family protein [Echinicola jeungdonensis]
MQQNFLVCFCDIKPDENAFHRQCYGSFALALTKHWGMRNKISPVRYVHFNSCGLEQQYIDLRNFTIGLFKSEHNFKKEAEFEEKIIKNVIAWSFWMDLRGNTNLVEEKINQEYKELIELLKPTNKDKFFNETILKFRQRIAELHHSLEIGDPFLRNYREDFTCPNSGETIKDKVLYDEREWRSCITTHSPEDVVVCESDNGITMKGFLKENHNLVFIDEDLIEIRLDRAESKNKLYRFLEENNTNLDIDLTMDKVKINQ